MVYTVISEYGNERPYARCQFHWNRCKWHPRVVLHLAVKCAVRPFDAFICWEDLVYSTILLELVRTAPTRGFALGEHQIRPRTSLVDKTRDYHRRKDRKGTLPRRTLRYAHSQIPVSVCRVDET